MYLVRWCNNYEVYRDLIKFVRWRSAVDTFASLRTDWTRVGSRPSSSRATSNWAPSAVDRQPIRFRLAARNNLSYATYCEFCHFKIDSSIFLCACYEKCLKLSYIGKFFSSATFHRFQYFHGIWWQKYQTRITPLFGGPGHDWCCCVGLLNKGAIHSIYMQQYMCLKNIPACKNLICNYKYR